uniref:ZFPL1-like U-box domain-containing protein n=1 Tax=Oryza barthii TaxID=65489 RepID=A0A0D3HCK3_9ORYZ
MLNGLLILIMTGHNTVHLAILFWKLEAKKLHDWVACIWPPSTIKDTGSRLHSKLKEAIAQTGLEKNVFGNHFVTMPKADTRTPPAFASDPLKRVSISGDRESNGANIIDSAIDANVQSGGMYSSATVGSGTPSHVEPEIVEIDGPSPITTQFPEQESNFIRSPSPHGPSAMTRKGANYVERQNSEISYYADDEDANRKKYTKRGTFRHKFLRMLLPFWSSALPTLPVTAPPRKESDAPEGRSRHQKSSRMDPTKILLALAIMRW